VGKYQRQPTSEKVVVLINCDVDLSQNSPCQWAGECPAFMMWDGCHSPVGMSIKGMTTLLPDSLETN
jgi:hypothetical protein